MTQPQPQHDDPFGEARAQLVQALAVMATGGEAAARWAAVGMQRRADQQAHRDRADQASAAARDQAEQLARHAELDHDRAEREYVAKAFDDQWLEHADLTATARLWRAANLRAATGDEWARTAMHRAEDQLRRLRPNLMAFYDRFRAEGRPPAEAMKAAAYGVWLHADNTTRGPRARPHPTRTPQAVRAGANGRALGPGGSIMDDLDAAVRNEVHHLADGIDPTILDRLQRQWRSAGLAPPADAAELLALYARELRNHGTPPVVTDHLHTAAHRTAQAHRADADHLDGHGQRARREAVLAAGTPDLTATVIDEHRQALDHATVAHGAADLDALRAAQADRMARTFPPLTVVQTIAPHLAGKHEAQTIPTRTRGRTR